MYSLRYEINMTNYDKAAVPGIAEVYIRVTGPEH